MKKLLVVFIVVLLFQPLAAQQYFGTPAADGHRVLILMNPTVNNLTTMFYLIDNQILSLPEDYHMVGFFSSLQGDDFALSAEFIRQSGRNNIFLESCKGEIGAAVFAENACSEDFRKVFAGSQGVIFFGGPDIPPSLYGAETNLLTEITDYNRHTFEASFLFHLLGGFQNENYQPLLEKKPEYRILGICLGMQTLNVATGGTLFQDIPTEKYNQRTVEQALAAEPDARHRNYNTNFGTDDDLIWGHFHRIKITAPERLQPFMTNSDANPYVLSSHHQAAGRIGKGLVVAATSMDGSIVETLVHAKYPNVIGVQFHPEPTYLYKADEKLNQEPGKSAETSFIDLYGGAKGEVFNRNIWKWMGEKFK